MAATISIKAPINSEVLRWARESIGIAPEKAAKRAKVNLDIYKKWESGEERPSMSRLRDLAGLFKRPLPLFFLPHLPESPSLPKDFRKPSTIIEQPLSENSLLSIRKARWYQSVAKELMEDLGHPIPPVKHPNLNDAPLEDIVNTLRNISVDKQFAWKDSWEALKNWRNYLEEEGIFVFQFPLPSEEARGFSLVREGYSPVIAISSKDSPNGRIFTLFHEYCHILSRDSGLCIPSETSGKEHQETEKFCDDFAGHFLVPSHQLQRSIKDSTFQKVEELIPGLAHKFNVSQFVILRRLYSLGEIRYKDYRRLFKELNKSVKKVGSGGGDFYRNKYAEKGKKLISLVVESESSGKITLSRALDYLEIKTSQYERIVNKLYE